MIKGAGLRSRAGEAMPAKQTRESIEAELNAGEHERLARTARADAGQSGAEQLAGIVKSHRQA